MVNQKNTMRYCEQCGSQTGDSSFCGTCGARINEGPASKPSKAMDTKYAPPMVPAIQPSYNSPAVHNVQPSYGGMALIMPPERSYPKWFALIFVTSFLGIVIAVYAIIDLFNSLMEGSFGNFGTLLFLAFILLAVGGIARLIYGYHNFNDFRLLSRAGHGWQEESMEPALGLLLFLIFSPIAVFFKYNQFYKHMTQRHTDEANLPPKPLYVVLVIIIPYALSYLLPSLAYAGDFDLLFFNPWSLLTFASPLLMLYFENKWQNSLNEHIRNHKNFLTGQSTPM